MHCCDKPLVRLGRGDCLWNIGLHPSSRVTEWKWKTAAVRTLFVLTFEWMGGGISGARPRSRDHHGLLPDPGGEGHARLRLRRESWFR